MQQDSAVADSAVRISNLIFEHVARISRESGLASDVTHLLQLNADLARDLTGADRCSIWLHDPNQRQLWTRVAHGTVREIRIPQEAGIVGESFARRSQILVNDVAVDGRFSAAADQRSGYITRSILAVPLQAGGEVLGVMQVLNKPGGFTDIDQQLLSFMAIYTASAIQSEIFRKQAEEVRLLQRELDWAREVQNNLLPQEISPFSALEYSAIFRPARSVGGDYYDLITSSEDVFTFTLGDVSGKGLPAAVMMASIQTLLRNHLARLDLELSTLVQQASATIYQSSSRDRYSTLFAGRFEMQRHTLTYVNAGQVAPFILHQQSGRVERTVDSGFPIGLLPGVRYGQASVSIAPGDIVLCISDGFSEVQNAAGEIWDDSAVEQVLVQNASSSMTELLAQLLAKTDEYAGGAEPNDDRTAVAIRVLG